MKIKIKMRWQEFIKLIHQLRGKVQHTVWPPLARRRWDGGFNRCRAFRRTLLPVILRPDVPRDASERSRRALNTSVGGCFLRPNGVRNGGKTCPKWLLGRILEPLGLLKASWTGLGGLSGRSWRPLGRSWACLGRSWGGLGGILRAKRLPKRSPGGFKIGSQRRLESKTAKPQNFEDVSRNSLVFKVPGLPFWDQNGIKTGSKSRHRC